MNAEDASLGALALAGDFEGQHVRAVLQRASPTATIWYEGHFRLVPTGPRWGEDIIMWIWRASRHVAHLAVHPPQFRGDYGQTEN